MKPNKMEELIKLNLKANVLEKEIEKYKALVECYKSETKYASQLLFKTNKEKMQFFAEKKEKNQEVKQHKASLKISDTQ